MDSEIHLSEVFPHSICHGKAWHLIDARGSKSAYTSYQENPFGDLNTAVPSSGESLNCKPQEAGSVLHGVNSTHSS